MIKDDFYADEPALSSGIVPTKWIPDIFTDGDLKTNIAEPYIMGYIPYDESPQSLFDLHIISMGNNLTAINFGAFKENRAWGYCWQNSTGSTTRFAGQAYGIDSDNSLFALSSDTGRKIRFTNSIQYSQLFMVDNIDFQLETFCFPTANIDENENAHNGATNQGHSSTDYAIRRQDMHDFLNGTYTITGVKYRHPGDSTDYTTTLSYSDFDIERGIAKKVVDSDYTVYIIFNNVGGSLSGARYSYYNGSIWTEGAVNITPFILCSVDDSVGFNAQKILYTPLGFSSVGGQPRFTLQNSKETFAPSPAYSVNYHCIKHACTSWYGSLDTVNLSDFSKSSGIHYEMIRGRCFLHFTGGDGNTFEFVPIVKPLDIYRAYLLLNSVNTGVTAQASLTNPDPPNYSATQTVALFTGDNTPRYEYEQGDLAQAAVPAILQPWQMPNAYNYDNVFKVDDIPEYNPEPPEDDIHERHTGSTGGLFAGPIAAVSNFVTHWVLDASQVQAFGAHLWTDLLDFDAQGEPTGTQLWKNAKIALGTYFQTGSFDPGSIMELLIGLRYFPINLANSSYATQQSVPAVYFGTGRVGVDVTTNPWKLGQNAIYITGGDLDLSQLSWNKYGDWRDVYNVSASIYIPFCGTYELPWSDIYNGTLHLSYGIDILSGALTAFVECTLGLNRFLVCVGSGMVGFEVPITATSANRLNAAILGDMGNMMGTLFNPADAVKVATALTGGGGEGSTGGVPIGDMEPTASNAAGSAPIVGKVALAGRVAEIHTGIASRPGITCPAMPGGRGWGALTGQRIPFITIRKGRYASSAGYGNAEGHPRMDTASIGSVSGYTECINPDLSGIPCSKEEKDMIKQILETGFYA